jgi:hypothetical protein
VRQKCLSKYLPGLVLVIFLLAHFAPRQGLAFEPLVPLAQPGPWSAVDAIIGYGPRIWFANSELFRNHNAADIYSYDPASGTARYEQSLFSQGAGRPLIAGRLLYWPFEDPRFSADRAELPFHIHELIHKLLHNCATFDKENRKKVYKAAEELGFSTPSFQEFAHRLADFLDTATITLTELASANPNRINLGNPPN